MVMKQRKRSVVNLNAFRLFEKFVGRTGLEPVTSAV